MREQENISIDHIRGVFTNYDFESVPQDHLKDALNFTFLKNHGIETRKGILSLLSLASIVRIARYEIPGAAERILALDDSGNLFDTTASLVTPILTIASMTDFSCVSLYGRAYISPHNSTEGLQDTAIYVYDPSKTPAIREAAGIPPSDFDLVVASTVPQAITNIANAQAFTDGVALTLTSSPFVPTNPNTIKFTMVKGTSTITAMDIDVVGFDAGGTAQTKTYHNKILSANPLTYTTFEEWKSVTSITPKNIVGAIGTATLKAATTGKPAGKVEKGYHIVAIAYETDSGFITPPGPASGSGRNMTIDYNVFYVSHAKKVLTVSGIPATPPAGTSKIHILVSKAIVKARYTGNPDEYQLFFVPKTSGGEVAVGTTSQVINFFDADLVDSADFLKDNLSRIPAGVCLLATSKGRLLLGGVNSTSSVVPAPDPGSAGAKTGNNTVVWGSKGGEPESFSATDGFLIVKPGGEGIKNLAEYRGLIYPFKSTRTYVTQDNGDLLSTWELDVIDNAIGAECHGVSVALGSDSATNDALIVASREGLQLFAGVFAEKSLSWKIKQSWDSIRVDRFKEIEVAVDPINRFIYAAVPLDPDVVGPNKVFMADYSEGLDPENIKWMPFEFYRLNESAATVVMRPTSIITHLRSSDNAAILLIGSLDNNIHEYHYTSAAILNDNGAQIAQFVETFKWMISEKGGVGQFTGFRLRLQCTGIISSEFRSAEDGVTYTLPTLTLDGSVPTFNNIFVRGNFVADQTSLKMTVIKNPAITDDAYLLVSKIWIYGKELWAERPA